MLAFAAVVGAGPGLVLASVWRRRHRAARYRAARLAWPERCAQVTRFNAGVLSWRGLESAAADPAVQIWHVAAAEPDGAGSRVLLEAAGRPSTPALLATRVEPGCWLAVDLSDGTVHAVGSDADRAAWLEAVAHG